MRDPRGFALATVSRPRGLSKRRRHCRPGHLPCCTRAASKKDPDKSGWIARGDNLGLCSSLDGWGRTDERRKCHSYDHFTFSGSRPDLPYLSASKAISSDRSRSFRSYSTQSKRLPKSRRLHDFARSGSRRHGDRFQRNWQTRNNGGDQVHRRDGLGSKSWSKREKPRRFGPQKHFVLSQRYAMR